MNQCSKWQTTAEQHLNTGDLVWVVEETNRRGYYPTAGITKFRDGPDSVACSAVMRKSAGSLIRPLVYLVHILATSFFGPEEFTD